MNFSVLMSVYEKESPVFLRLALDSIYNQSKMPTEVVIVQDGPLVEGLYNIIEEYSTRYSLITKNVILKENVGLGKALNEGLRQCSFDLVARMDTDDIAMSDRFEKQLAFMEENLEVSVLGTAVQEFDKMPGDLNQIRRLPSDTHEVLKFSKFRNPLNHPSVMFRKNDVLNVGSYQDMPLFEDYFLWVRMMLKGYCIANLEEPLLYFRIGNDMVGRRHGRGYLKKEVAFLKAINKLTFISNYQYMLSVITKSPLRLLPKRVLMFIYKNFLR